jgi:hypothetical protein
MNKVIIYASLVTIVILAIFVFLLLEQTDNVSNIQNIQYNDAEQIYDNCKDEMHCVVDSLNNIAKTEQKNLVLTTFSEVSVLYGSSKEFQCHMIIHHLGMWLYGYTGELDEAFKYASPICAGGHYHGIFQNYFLGKSLEGAEPNEIQIVGLCDRIDENSGLYNKSLCMHGVGHGLEVLYNYDTVNSAPRCDELKTLSFQKNCLNGVFMEKSIDILKNSERDSDGKELYFSCNENELRNLDSCYLWQAWVIVRNNDNELFNSFGECDKIHYEAGIKNCYYGIGKTVWTYAKNSSDRFELYCEDGKRTEYHAYCIRGMVMLSSTNLLDNGFIVCSIIDEKFKHSCYDALGYWIQLRFIDENQKIELCSKSEKEYFDVCMNPDMNDISHL